MTHSVVDALLHKPPVDLLGGVSHLFAPLDENEHGDTAAKGDSSGLSETLFETLVHEPRRDSVRQTETHEVSDENDHHHGIGGNLSITVHGIVEGANGGESSQTFD